MKKNTMVGIGLGILGGLAALGGGAILLKKDKYSDPDDIDFDEEIDDIDLDEEINDES